MARRRESISSTSCCPELGTDTCKASHLNAGVDNLEKDSNEAMSLAKLATHAYSHLLFEIGGRYCHDKRTVACVCTVVIA